VQERGYEGFVAKDESSPYAGGRTLSWLKVKQAESAPSGSSVQR
jgi:ATP-dependent DNA ligase